MPVYNLVSNARIIVKKYIITGDYLDLFTIKTWIPTLYDCEAIEIKSRLNSLDTPFIGTMGYKVYTDSILRGYSHCVPGVGAPLFHSVNVLCIFLMTEASRRHGGGEATFCRQFLSQLDYVANTRMYI